MAVIAHHTVWLADRSTEFRVVALHVEDILVAEPVTDIRMSQGRAGGPVIGIGFALGGGLMGTIGMGRSPKPPRLHVRHGLSLHYLAGVERRPRSTLIPFGADLPAAQAAAAMLARPAVVPRPDLLS